MLNASAQYGTRYKNKTTRKLWKHLEHPALIVLFHKCKLHVVFNPSSWVSPVS